MPLDPITYDQSDSNFTVPAGVAATLTGSDDTVTLSAGDTLVAAGLATADNIDATIPGLSIEAQAGSALSIYASSPVLTVDAGSAVQILDGGTVSIGPAATGVAPAAISVSNDDLSVLTTITGAAPATIGVQAGAAVDITDPAASISITGQDGTFAFDGFAGAASYALRANPDDYTNVVDTIVGSTQAGQQGAFAGEIADFNDGTSEVLMPGSGLFGVYEDNAYYSEPEGRGSEVSSILDVYNGKTDTSIYQVYQPLDDGSGIIGGYALYSGPDLTGTETANFNFDDGTSGHFAPFPSGAFGCYQVVNYYTGANETGQNDITSYDFVNGTSQSSLTTNGGFGCYKAELRTDGLNANGDITQVTFDFVSGISRTITATSRGETDVYTSGLDGTGSVLSSTTDAFGTAEATLNAVTGLDFTNPTAFEPVFDPPTLVAKSNVTLADFAATKGSAAAMVAAADPVAGLRAPVASPLGAVAATLSQPVAPAVLLHGH